MELSYMRSILGQFHLDIFSEEKSFQTRFTCIFHVLNYP